MTISHNQLLDDVRKVASGQPPSGMWRKALQVNAWRLAGLSSRNYWDMALPGACVVDPALAAEWITRRLAREHAAWQDEAEFYRFDAFEFNSPLYHGWSASALLVAYARFEPKDAQQEAARALLRRHLRARTLIWALCSHSEVVQGGGRYRGPGGYPAGLRGKPYYLDRNDNQKLDQGEKVNEFNQANPTYAHILGIDFGWRWRKHVPVARLVEAEGIFSQPEKQRIERVLATDLNDQDVEWLRRELDFVRVVIPYEIFRTDDRVVTFLDGAARDTESPMPIRHTAPLWYSELVLGRPPYCPWPYSTTRLRQSRRTRDQWRAEVQRSQGARMLTAEESPKAVYRLQEYRRSKVTRTRRLTLPPSPRLWVRFRIDDPPVVRTS